VPTFCRHNPFLYRSAICRREAEEAAAARRPAARSARAASPAARRGGAPSRVRSGAGVRVRREQRAEDDGYRTDLVAGLRASADAERLAEEIAFSCGRLLVLATEPPGAYAQARELVARDASPGAAARAGWILFVTAYLCPIEGEAPFAGIERVLAQDRPDLAGVPLGPRSSHDASHGTRTLDAYKRWLTRASDGAGDPFAGEPSWTPARRFERLYERLALPGLTRAARYDLLVSLERLGVSAVEADSLQLVQARGEPAGDAALLAAKRVFGIGDPLLLERRAAALADAAGVPIAALDLALANWGAAERASMGVSPDTRDATALQDASDALGV
jgi:hypothetical protein